MKVSEMIKRLEAYTDTTEVLCMMDSDLSSDNDITLMQIEVGEIDYDEGVKPIIIVLNQAAND